MQPLFIFIMDNIAIIFGGDSDLYIHWFKVFKNIENVFNCTIRRRGNFKYSTRIGNTLLNIFFCINPIQDSNYFYYKQFYETVPKKLIPPSADKVAKKVAKSNKVLFFGLCGSLHNGRKDEIHTPYAFREILFPNHFITKDYIPKIKLSRNIEFSNFLLRKIKGKKSKGITSNITLMPDYVEDSSTGLIMLSKILSSYGDIVEKEAYEIIKQLKNIPVGIMLMTSDILYNKKGMLKNNHTFKPNIFKFNKALINSIKEALINKHP